MELILPGSLFVFMMGGLIMVHRKLDKRPTWEQVNERFKETKVCNEIHKSITEKLDTLPGMQESLTRIETILKERGNNEN